MSYLTRIVLKMYEQQAIQSVVDSGVGIVSGGATTNVLFRFRSFIHLNNYALSAGINRFGDVVVWESKMFKSANEATDAMVSKIKIIKIVEVGNKREIRDNSQGSFQLPMQGGGGVKKITREEYEAWVKQQQDANDMKKFYDEVTGRKPVEEVKEDISKLSEEEVAARIDEERRVVLKAKAEEQFEKFGEGGALQRLAMAWKGKGGEYEETEVQFMINIILSKPVVVEGVKADDPSKVL